MTKPAPEAAESTSTATAASSKPADAVQDLERRLQMLETTSSNNTTAKTVEAPAAKPAPSTTAAAGKNPLLVGGLFGKEKTNSSLCYSVCLTTCKQ